MRFNKLLIITGMETRRKQDGTAYQMLHILMDNGQTCSLIYKGEDSLPEIKIMEKYNIEFVVVINKYGTMINVDRVVTNAK